MTFTTDNQDPAIQEILERHSPKQEPPNLLTLPLELRRQIYSHLCPPTSLSNPIPNVGLSSVSHTPPPLSLLLVCQTLTSDLLTYFYSAAQWKLIASHAFNFYRIDSTLSNFASSAVLKRLEKVELVFWFDGALLADYPSLKTAAYCNEIKNRAKRACEILAQAEALRVLVVSWVDTTAGKAAEEKKGVLEALQALNGSNVQVEVGVLEWSGAQAGKEREDWEKMVRGWIEDVCVSAAC
ncbi:hypothetical protein M436DRAFT_81544 [Aureobasidium namibiae CBS 147.97]|uniref:F-box domain-containing protein n=1 Tax=Aureobasidium namibiae CBS 147.97 TaxID=1043004 RepID=A0A074XHW2_9PEZI